MKITRVLFLTLAAASIAACSNDKEEEITGQKKDLIIEFNLPETVNTRAVENPVSNGTSPTLENIVLNFDGGTPPVTLAKSDLELGNKATVQVNDQTRNVTSMIANSVTGVNISDIHTYQSKSLITEIPLYAGNTAISDGSVALSPKAYVARIEILGGKDITPASSSYSKIQVTDVYINNYYKSYTLGAATGTSTVKVAEAAWATTYKAGNPMYNTITTSDWNSKCAAYQIFPANTAATLPEITLKLSYTKKGVPTVGYLTIRKFKKGNADLTAMEAGKIYKLDVSTIGSLFKEEPGTGDPTDPTDPTPGKPKADLAITVTVTAWIAENITPNI